MRWKLCTVAAVLAPLVLTAPGLGQGALLVINKSEDTLVRVDLRDGAINAVLETAAGPHELLVSPDGRRLYIADYGSSGFFRNELGRTISVIDLQAFESQATFDLGAHTKPHGMAISRDGRKLWVTTEGSGSVLELDTGSGEILRAWESGGKKSHMLVATRDEKRLFVTNTNSGSVSVIERDTGRIRVIETGAGAEGIDLHPGGGEVWVANNGARTLSIINVARERVVAVIPVQAQMPIRVKFTPDGTEAWVPAILSNRVIVFDTRTRGPIAEIDVALAGNLPGPVGLLITPDGTRAYVAHTLADQVAEIDVETRQLLRTFATGDEPDGLAWLPGPSHGEPPAPARIP